MDKLEVAELVNQLSNNIDEAEQFSYYIPEILKHCDKKYLIKLGNDLADIIEQNKRLGKTHLQLDDDSELDGLIRLIRKLGNKTRYKYELQGDK